jgi:hypothetical protein
MLQLLSSFLFLDVSRGSLICIVSGYRLDHRAIEVRPPAEAKGFFLYTGSESHPASYPVGTGDPFHGAKAWSVHETAH